MMWFSDKRFDLTFFHGPIWLCWVLVACLPDRIIHADISIWVWVSVVLLIDVGHVWSSIYRTYLDPVTRKHQLRVLQLAPLLCLLVCGGLALHSNLLFWRVLAYIATFHFIKQQIGIAALYRASWSPTASQSLSKLQLSRLWRLDKWTTYAGTLCPVIWWHFHLPRKISWFIQGDYIDPHALVVALPPLLVEISGYLFYTFWVGIIVLHLWVHLVWLPKRGVTRPWGKLLWIQGTCFNWFLGLVWFDSDLVFTLTNVVAHGVPYYGLIALHQTRKRAHLLNPKRIVALLFIPILLLATIEEFFWDIFLYAEHQAFFAMLWGYTDALLSNPTWRALAMALLALPQTVHYVLDGFIWKFNGKNPDLALILSSR